MMLVIEAGNDDQQITSGLIIQRNIGFNQQVAGQPGWFATQGSDVPVEQIATGDAVGSAHSIEYRRQRHHRRLGQHK